MDGLRLFLSGWSSYAYSKERVGGRVDSWILDEWMEG